MLNRTKIVKRFNKANNKRISANSDAMISAFIDMEMADITEEMILKCIDTGAICTKWDLMNPQYIKSAYERLCEYEDEEPVVVAIDVSPISPIYEDDEPMVDEPVVDEPVVAQPVVDPSNPFAPFEQMINGVVLNQSAPMVEKMVEDRMTKWCDENASKIQKKIEYISPTGKTMDAITHHLFDEVVKITQANEPVLLVGPAGTGKNHLAQQVAEFLDLDFYYTSSVTQEHKLMGFIDANGNYHETPFYKAATLGGLLFMDELDNSDPEILKATVNAAFDNGYVDFPTGKVEVHENFRVIAAANTFGTGASYEYVGANQLDASTLDRFAPIYIDYDERIENALTDDVSLLEFIRTFRKACVEYGIHHIASYRAIRRCDKFEDAFGVAESLKIGLLKNLEQDDMNMIVNKFSGLTDKWSSAFCDIARGC